MGGGLCFLVWSAQPMTRHCSIQFPLPTASRDQRRFSVHEILICFLSVLASYFCSMVPIRRLWVGCQKVALQLFGSVSGM